MLATGKGNFYFHHGAQLANGKRENVNAFTVKIAQRCAKLDAAEYWKSVLYPALTQYAHDAQLKELDLATCKANYEKWVNE
jgi:hypothetical protein